MPPAETGDSWVMLSHDLRGKECTGCVGGGRGKEKRTLHAVGTAWCPGKMGSSVHLQDDTRAVTGDEDGEEPPPGGAGGGVSHAGLQFGFSAVGDGSHRRPLSQGARMLRFPS